MGCESCRRHTACALYHHVIPKPLAAPFNNLPLGHTSRRPQMGLIPLRSHHHERRVDGGGAPHGSICAKLCVRQGTSAAAAAYSLGKGTYPNLNVEVRAAHLLRASKFMQVVPRQTHLHELPAGCVLFPGVPGALPDSSVGESCINRLKAQSSRDSEVHQMYSDDSRVLSSSSLVGKSSITTMGWDQRVGCTVATGLTLSPSTG